MGGGDKKVAQIIKERSWGSRLLVYYSGHQTRYVSTNSSFPPKMFRRMFLSHALILQYSIRWKTGDPQRQTENQTFS